MTSFNTSAESMTVFINHRNGQEKHCCLERKKKRSGDRYSADVMLTKSRQQRADIWTLNLPTKPFLRLIKHTKSLLLYGFTGKQSPPSLAS